MSDVGKEFSGRSVDEAIAAGLQALGLRSNQVRTEIVNKGSRGLFGIGSEPAVVRLIPIEISQPTTTITENAAVNDASINNSAPTTPVSTPIPTSASDAAVEKITTTAAISAEPSSTEEFSTDEMLDESEESGDPAEDEAETESASVEMLAKMVELMGFRVNVEPVWKDGDDEHDKRVLWLEIRGNNLSTLIGRRGETLENIQYLLRMMVNQKLHRWNDIVVDVEQYRTRRAEQLAQLANRMADQALSAGRAMALEPMPPNERRIVHMALRNHPHVYTQSSGDGERRKIFIVPKS